MGYRVHIVGCAPRGGTTLLKELFVNGFQTTSLTPHEVSVLVRPRRLRKVCVSKHPHEVATASRMLKLDPQLWVVYSLRDPRDVVCSRHPNDASLYWVGFDTWVKYDSAARSIAHPRFITVRYEELVGSPDDVQESLLKKMPFLTPVRQFSEYLATNNTSDASRRAMHNAARIHGRSIGSWRRNLGRVREQLERYPEMVDHVRERGYEEDNSWTDLLRDVPVEDCREKPRGRGKKYRITRRRLKRFWLGTKYVGKLYLDIGLTRIRREI